MTVILLVEDELLIRMSLTDTLVDAGYRVLEARNAAEALEIISARDDVDVLITDVRMPGSMDGIALAWDVAGRCPDIAIIVTSGHAQPAATDLPDGAMFLAKPYWPTAMSVVVAGVLASRPERLRAADPIAAAVTSVPPSVANDMLQIVPGEPIGGERENDGETEA